MLRLVGLLQRIRGLYTFWSLEIKDQEGNIEKVPGTEFLGNLLLRVSSACNRDVGGTQKMTYGSVGVQTAPEQELSLSHQVGKSESRHINSKNQLLISSAIR